MSRLDVDVAIAGSGFAGSLLAAVLQRNGLRVALIDRARHPRFAIGESSTPTASLILRGLADRHGLDWLRPLSQYGTWKQSYPGLTAGIKRGFSYFWHETDREFLPIPDHGNELLVAASSSDEVSDTHWLRSEVDAFLFDRACGEGVVACETTEIEMLSRIACGWRLECVRPDGPVEVRCRVLIDATGAGGLLSQRLQIADETHLLRTNSRAIFGHFAGLPRWSRVFSAKADSAASDHPFDCDHSALHHLIPGGWMWWLRFDNDVTSVGLVLDGDRSPADHASAAVGFSVAIDRLPDLQRLFFRAYGSCESRAAGRADFRPLCSTDARRGFHCEASPAGTSVGVAQLVGPPGGLVRTGRLQRLSSQIAGPGWAMLPHAAGFIDPLHSSGIAHSLSGVERLAGILIQNRKGSDEHLDAELQNYADTVRSELLLIDRLVSGCYSALRQRSFRKFVAWSMCYFAAATSWERRRLETPDKAAALFLADVPDFQQAVDELQSRLDTESDDSFEQLCEERLAPFNHVGLFQPAIPNMYARTAVPND
jgi:FADH2 O2-dependent halogenase